MISRIDLPTATRSSGGSLVMDLSLPSSNVNSGCWQAHRRLARCHAICTRQPGRCLRATQRIVRDAICRGKLSQRAIAASHQLSRLRVSISCRICAAAGVASKSSTHVMTIGLSFMGNSRQTPWGRSDWGGLDCSAPLATFGDQSGEERSSRHATLLLQLRHNPRGQPS